MIKAKRKPVITVDGPAASGKGELCRRLADHFKFDLLDSGAIYRILAFRLNELRISAPKIDDILISGVKKSVPLERLMASKKLTPEGEKIKRACTIARELKISFKLEKKQSNQEQLLTTEVLLENKAIGAAIRSNQVGSLASNWAVFPAIRDALLEKQRSFANQDHSKKPLNGLIADGRDMGSEVFKDAKVKFFITASQEIRAQRRAKELRIDNDSHKMRQLFLSIQQRDQQDAKRAVSPLVKPKGATEIDTSDLTIDQVFDKALLKIQSILKP